MAQVIPSTPFYITKSRSTFHVLKDALIFTADHANVLLLSTMALAVSIILLSTCIAYLITQAPSPFQYAVLYKALDKNTFLIYIIAFMVYTIGIGLYNLLINKHLLLADYAHSTKRKPDFNSLKNDIAHDFKKASGNYYIFFIAVFILIELLNYFTNNKNDSGYYQYTERDLNYYSELMLGYLPKIIIIPLGTYFIIAALYVCHRDSKDTSGAIRKVWAVSHKNIGKVWLTSTLIFIAFLVSNYLLNQSLFLLFYYAFFSIFNLDLHLLFFALQLIFSFLLFIFVQTSTILLFGSMEDEEENHYLKNKINELQI